MKNLSQFCGRAGLGRPSAFQSSGSGSLPIAGPSRSGYFVMRGNSLISNWLSIICLLIFSTVAGWAAEMVPLKIDLAAFAPVGGKGTVALTGNVLRLEVDAAAIDFQVSSAEFPVTPWKFLRARIDGAIDPGVYLSLALLPADPKTQAPLLFTESSDGLVIGVPPGWDRARLAVQLYIPGKAVGRTVRFRALALETLHTQPPAPLTCPNMYWNGSFESAPIGDGIPADWGNWGGNPQGWSIVEDSTAADGKRFLRVKSEKGTFIVPPRLPVEPFGFYRFSCRFRGTGHPRVALFKQDDGTIRGKYRQVTQGRIGSQEPSPAAASLELQPDQWREVSLIFSTEPGVQYANIYIQYYAVAGTLDIDAVEMLPVNDPKFRGWGN